MTQVIRGNAIVASLARPSGAFTAAVEFQEMTLRHNAGLKDDIRSAIHIGIASGEVVIANNAVTGTGVVLANDLSNLHQKMACMFRRRRVPGMRI